MGDAEWLEVKCEPELMAGACGGVAILVRRKGWMKGDPIRAGDLRWPDGRACEAGERIVCASCGKGMNTPGFARLVTKAVREAGLEKTPYAPLQP